MIRYVLNKARKRDSLNDDSMIEIFSCRQTERENYHNDEKKVYEHEEYTKKMGR